jgi:hypothetical protein
MASIGLQEEWRRRARVAQTSHYKSAAKLESRHRRWGVLVVTLNALVGTTVFASLSRDFNIWIKVATGVVSVLAAVLAAIQAFDRAGERAETHRKAATQFSALQRDVELYAATGSTPDSEDAKFLKDFNARYVQLVNESPTADEALFRRVEASFRDEEAKEAATKAG